MRLRCGVLIVGWHTREFVELVGERLALVLVIGAIASAEREVSKP
jgi:hypothetical protein